MTLPARWLAAACGLTFAIAAVAPLTFAQEEGGMKPMAMAVVSSVDELMGDVDFLGSLGGQPQASQSVEGMLQMFTQGQGLAGLDRARPIGVLVQSDGAMFAGAVCLPVTDSTALLDVVKNFGVTTEDLGDGLIQVKGPQGEAMFAKEVNEWLLMSMSPDMLEGLPAELGEVFAPLAEVYDLAFRVDMQNVPEAYRQMAVDAMSQGAQQGISQADGESDEDFADRQAQVEAQLDELKRFMNEVDQLTFGLSIDGDEQRAFIDFAYTAMPGTKLAQDLEAGNNATTDFAGFFQPDAAMTLSFASKMTGADQAQLDQMIETLRKQAARSIEEEADLQNEESREKLTSAVNDFIDALAATLEEGVIDGGATLNLTPDSLTFIAGGYIADPAKVESGLKKVAEVAEAEEGEDVPDVSWSAATHGDVTFHTMSVPVPEEEADEAGRLFGENVDMAVGIGKEAVYFAMGPESMAAVQQAIDASQQSLDKQIAPFELTVALGQIMKAAESFADEDDKQQIGMIAEMLSTETSGRDHVRIVGQPIENGIRMRIEAEEGVLRAIGMAGMQAQMQGAGF